MSDRNAIYDLPADIMEQLLCSYCNSYISCGPVKVKPDGGSICGRCSPSSHSSYARNVLFETAMSKFTFPCRYKSQGCNQRVLFNKAAEHEDMCPHHAFPCPSLPHSSCSESLSVFNVYKHFEENHSDLITTDGKFKIDLEENYQCNLLMVVDEVVVAVQYSYDSMKSVVNLDVRHFLHDTQRKAYFKLQIISGSDDDRALHLKESQCKRYESHIINEQNALSFLMNNYLPALDNPTFIFIKVLLKIIKNSPISNSQQYMMNNVSLMGAVVKKQLVDEQHKQVVRNAWNLLEKVRCMRCKCIVTPPVYECSIRHRSEIVLLCMKCKQVTERKGDVQNSVEKQYSALTYPCCWRGCTFMGNEVNITAHKNECPQQPYICPLSSLNCKGYFTSNDLMDHMLQHGTFCPDPANIVIELFSEKIPVENVYFTVFDKMPVVITCVISDDEEWHLNCTCKGFRVAIYFEHDHCNMKSKTFSYTDGILDIKYDNFEEYFGYHGFPVCFSYYNRIEAIIKLEKM